MESVRKKSSEFHPSVLDVIRHRRSRRAYDTKLVPQEDIDSLFEAARWAPSSVNEQPWLYIYATSDQKELWHLIFDSLNEGNKIWVRDVPLLIASFARTNFSRNDKPNGAARYDLGGANAILSLQATHLGLNVHQMGGFDAARLRANLNVPATYEPMIVLAVGYPGEAEKLPENLKIREAAPRERYVRDEFVLNTVFK
jgi:nitroreductase